MKRTVAPLSFAGLARRFVPVGLLAAGLASAAPATGPWRVASPDGRIRCELKTNEAGGLSYRVLCQAGAESNLVLDWSRLGVTKSHVDQSSADAPKHADFSQTVAVAGTRTRHIEETYELLTGKRRRNVAVAEELALNLLDAELKEPLRLELRVYNEGVAFRYVFTGRSELHHWLADEATEFNVGAGGTHWGQPYDKADTWRPSYETPYTNGLPSGTAADPARGTGWGFPSLFHQRGIWLLLHEAGVTRQSHGSHLRPEAPAGLYRVAFPLAAEAMGFGANFPAATLPWALPWRLIIVGENLGQIVENNLVFHVSEPSRIADTSWIKPGVASWSWWSDHASSQSLEKLQTFIDVAAEMRWPYSLVDANWNRIAPDAMGKLVAYANRQRVGLLFWYNSGGRHNFVTEEPRNLMDDPSRRKAEFAKLQRLGVKGVKVDFFQSDKQDIMQQYLDILEDAAAYRLLVVFHGCTIPRGWARTWPNLMSMEAVRGAEFYTFPSEPDYGRLAPAQNTVLPFTRNVIGSMDYTPVSFAPQQVARVTTNAHEAALGVVFESGILHVCDSAASLRALPEAYRAYLRELPTVWDETRLLSGHPGRAVVLARRDGQSWYVAGLNGETTPKTITLNLAALGATGASGTLLHDAPGAGRFASAPLTIPASGDVRIEMAAAGGFVLILKNVARIDPATKP